MAKGNPTIQVRLSIEDLADVLERANAVGKTPAAWARELILLELRGETQKATSRTSARAVPQGSKAKESSGHCQHLKTRHVGWGVLCEDCNSKVR